MTNLPPSLSELVALSHRAADASGETIVPFFRSNLVVDNKGAGAHFDPVTECDRAAEIVIRNTIAADFPDHAILGEEHGEKAASGRYRWVIDPIDGTRAFILGLPTWATLIGLEQDDRPVIGMMNQPYTRDRFWSDGSASYLRGGTDKVRRIQTRSQISDLRDAQLASTHPDLFADGFEKAVFQRICETVKATRYGTDCFAYAMLATGLIDIVIEAGLKPYDIVALIPIIEHAGGVITTWDGGPARHGGQILASANPTIHQQAMDIIAANI